MSSPLTPRQRLQQAAADRQHNVVTNEPITHPTGPVRRGSLTKAMAEHHDPSVDLITHQAKSPEAVQRTPGKDASAMRVHKPFTQGSADKGGFDIISGTSNTERQASAKEAILSPRSRIASQQSTPYDPVTGLELKYTPGSDKKISHGAFKKEMAQTHTNVNPITGDKIEPPKLGVSAGAFRRELHDNGLNVDPILGKPKTEPVKSPSNSNFKKAAMEAQGQQVLSPRQAYDPVTGQEVNYNLSRSGSSHGAFKKEMVEMHVNVDPITGQKVTPFKPAGPSHGSIKAELLRQGQSGNPIG